MLKKSERKNYPLKPQSKESVMATLRYLRGKWYASLMNKNGTKGETLTPLRTSLKVTAHERIIEVDKVESDIKAGMKFKFPWLNESGITKNAIHG